MRSRPLPHAIVAGGSIAGLLAVRVLSDHFEQVTLIERDRVACSPEPRNGVPQGPHAHGLLVRGRSILEDLFPGLVRELCAAGAVPINAGREFGWHHAGGWRARHDSDLTLLALSRPLLECTIAKRVRALRNVMLLEGVRVEGLRSDTDRNVTGVRARLRDSSRTEEVAADLVADATGRGSQTPSWLSEPGFAAPMAELLPARVAYTSCTFTRSKVELT